MTPDTAVRTLGIALGVATMLTLSAPVATAHHDPPGAPALEDQIALNVIARTDQDDGVFGESEYCIRIKVKHPGHDALTEEFVNCFSANWDTVDPATGMPFDAAITPGAPNGGKMPLMAAEITDATGKVVRAGGIGGGPFRSAFHPECSPTQPWEVEVRLAEDDTSITDILKKIGEALQEKKLPIPGADAGRVELLGMAATLVSGILDEIFGRMEDNLGVSRPTWGTGEGDPAGEVDKSESVFHFSVEAKKTVRSVPSEDHKCKKDPPPFCPLDENHLFSIDPAVASRAWDKFRDAARDIDTLGSEAGGVAPSDVIDAQKRSLRQLVAVLGRFVAQVEVDEALAAPGKVPANVLAQAQLLIAEGDTLRDQALAADDTPLLLAALDRYRGAFELLLSLVHPDPTQVCEEPFLVNESVTLEPVESSFAAELSTAGCPAGFAGMFRFDATLTNTDSVTLTNLHIMTDVLGGAICSRMPTPGPAARDRS